MAAAVRAVERAPRARLPRALRIAALFVLLLYPLAAGVLLLTSDGWAVNRANVQVWYVATGLVGLREQITPESFAAFANVVLFVPFFAALAVLRPTWWWVLLGAAISTCVELYQGSIGSRMQDSGDVVTNTLGAAFGVAIGFGLRRLALNGAGSAPSAPTTPGAPLADSALDPDGGRDDRG